MERKEVKMPKAKTRTIDSLTYHLDEVKRTKREANILAYLYRRRNGWKVRVIQSKGGYGIWVSFS